MVIKKPDFVKYDSTTVIICFGFQFIELWCTKINFMYIQLELPISCPVKWKSENEKNYSNE